MSEDATYGLVGVPLRQTNFDLVETFTYSGNLGIGDLTYRLYNDTTHDRVIRQVRLSLGVPAIGRPVIVDLKKNGVSVFNPYFYYAGPGNRPFLSSGESTMVTTPEKGKEVWEVGSYLTVSITQIGATVSGADMTLQVALKE